MKQNGFANWIKIDENAMLLILTKWNEPSDFFKRIKSELNIELKNMGLTPNKEACILYVPINCNFNAGINRIEDIALFEN